jgi:nucleotide-binding universal stress UspA family protein
MLDVEGYRRCAMFRRLLLPVVLGRIDAPALRVADALAGSFDAELRVLVGLSVVSPLMAGWEYFPAGVYDTMAETARAASSALARDVRALFAATGVAHDVIEGGSLWLTPAEQALPHAYVADLIVHGRTAQPQDAERSLFAALLLSSGRPLLLVPPGEPPAAFERIVVAWKPTRESARALHDALPLLLRARAVQLLTIGPGDGDREQTDALLGHLALHGVTATAAHVARGGDGTGRTLLAFAREHGAELVVAGGYGRSRVSEQVFGGVTRVLFELAEVPVLFSH